MLASPPTTPALDRRSALREDAAVLASLTRAPSARFLILAGGRPAIRSSADRSHAAIRWFEPAEIAALGTPAQEALFLGLDPGSAAGRFALALDEETALRHEALLKPAVDIRSLVTQGVMAPAELAVIAEARALAEWNARARYCGRCGAPARVSHGGWRRTCGACSEIYFPRVDPVVIMLVTDGARCLLAREPRFPEGMYSALAGFLEPGEDVAGAVRRETEEETGLSVGDVAVVASQPWPFPHSLMLGCIARTGVGGELRLDPAEVEDARWLDAGALGAALAGRHPDGLWVPGRLTIANALMRHWLDGTETERR